MVEPAFVPEPSGRGTVGLLFSCSITLSLCVWTAIHGDITPGLKKWERLWAKLGWMLFAIFAPEVLVIIAFAQWKEARKLYRFWCDYFDVKAGSKEDMGMEGAFFVVMGGFTVPNGSKHRTLRPEGFKHLMETGAISKDFIDKNLIVDKGKADSVAKALVCFQAFWMVIQCIARKVDGLPITLLELHVVLQVACAAGMYLFWWYKPLDIQEPINIPNASLGDLQGVFDSDFFMDSSNSQFLDFSLAVDGIESVGSSAILCLLYGGCHLIAWNSHFPTTQERWLWRICCIIISCAFLVTILINDVGAFLGNRGRYLEVLKEDGVWSNKINPPDWAAFLAYFVLLMYFLSVGFVTVEAFISMRSLPDGAYQSVRWTNYFPHV